MKIIIHSPPLILFHVNALLTALSALAVISLPTTCTVFLRLQHTLKSVFSPFTSYSKRHSSIFLDYRVLDITFLAFTHTQTRLVVQKLQVYTRDLIFFEQQLSFGLNVSQGNQSKDMNGPRGSKKKNVPHESHGKLGLFQSCWGFGAHWIASVNHRMKMMKKKETNITLFPFLIPE